MTLGTNRALDPKRELALDDARLAAVTESPHRRFRPRHAALTCEKRGPSLIARSSFRRSSVPSRSVDNGLCRCVLDAR